MARALEPWMLSRFAVLAALAALLVVPALHGTLDHQHARCDGAAASGCELAAADASLAGAAGAGVCPLCLASSQARTLLVASAGEGLAASDATARPLALPAVPAAPTPLARAICAPRAPPVRS